MNFRKFLIISSYAPPAISGAPLMMHNLLRYFPENSFVILTSHFGIDKQADKNRWLRANYFFFDTPLLTSVLQREKTFSQKLKVFLKNFFITKFLAQIFLIFYLPFNSVRLGRQIIKEEKIELLLGYSDFGPALFATYLLHRITRKPFFLYFYDLYYGNKFPFIYRVLAKFLEPKLFRKAEQIFVMSEALRDYYQERYKRNISVIHNSVLVEKAREISLPKQTKMHKIVYTGSVYWAQADAIRNLIKAVEEIKDIDIQFYLYTPHDEQYLKKQGFLKSEKIVFAEGKPSVMVEIQKTADILFVPLSFHDEYSFLINTSSPGKMAEYFVSGRPILIHAPQESYIAGYAKKHNFAIVVDEENIGKLKNAIKELITNEKLVQELTTNALKIAFLNHDAKKNSDFFQSFFQKILHL